jgi:3-isopropylmalate/(R)-2-methylmalate dehydratase small subunit
MTKISEVKGRAVAVPGDDIDTDRIIPARYLKEITFTHMGDYPFFDERFDGNGNKKDHPFNRPEHQGASVLIANSNFGCGSSREHAPQALVRWGIRAIVAESFAEIFAGNCIMLGTPVATASPEHISRMQEIAGGSPEIEFTVDLSAGEIRAGDQVFPISISETRRKALTEGTWDSTSLLMANAGKTSEVAARLGYAAG